jgi:hypothetical protein
MSKPAQEPVISNEQYQDLLYEYCKLKAATLSHPAPLDLVTVNGHDLSKVTRLEVIDNNGRSYVNWGVDKMEFSYQDDGRTLKIFTNGSGRTDV